MKTYLLQINHYQLELFLKALNHMRETVPEDLNKLPGDDSTIIVFPEETMLDEATTLVEMLSDMHNDPNWDSEVINGLCL